MPDWQLETYELVAVAAAAAAGLALLLVLVVLARLRVLSKRLRRLAGSPRGGGDPAGPDESALRHVAVVRYDAFGDMGGRQSYSAALYDDRGNGLVISSINGRSETRTYAKGLVGLQSEHTLSPEEEQAIKEARR